MANHAMLFLIGLLGFVTGLNCLKLRVKSNVVFSDSNSIEFICEGCAKNQAFLDAGGKLTLDTNSTWRGLYKISLVKGMDVCVVNSRDLMCYVRDVEDLHITLSNVNSSFTGTWSFKTFNTKSMVSVWVFDKPAPEAKCEHGTAICTGGDTLSVFHYPNSDRYLIAECDFTYSGVVVKRHVECITNLPGFVMDIVFMIIVCVLVFISCIEYAVCKVLHCINNHNYMQTKNQ